MCGIAGLCRIDGQPLPPDASRIVKAMTDSMAHRGPDGDGQWQDGPICLGHRRLSIIDLAGGSQPMADVSGLYEIVFNGEIYNFRELRENLENRGASFRTASDTEVLLAAYALDGPDCLASIEGMFAFAIWDKPRQRLFCARDHFGKKPFYYTIQHGLFAFSSELRPLTVLKSAQPFAPFSFHLSPKAITRYLAYEYAPTPRTIYDEVKTLEPAHFLLLSKDSMRLRRYWSLPLPAEKPAFSDAEACAELRRLMGRAVSLRMISDVPLGVFLSGGIDSTIVAGLMAERSATPIQTFSIGFREASYDESGYARIAAKAYGTDHHERILSAEDCADELPRVVSGMDTPMADASCAPTWLLSGLARENVTVALGGDGSDELWAGYEHYIGYKIAQWYNRLPSFVRKKIIEPLARLLPASSGYINPRLAVQTFLSGAHAPDWLRVQTMLTAIGPDEQKKLLTPAWLEAAGQDALLPEKLFSPTRVQYECWPGNAPPLARAFHVYVRQFMLDDILVKVDRCSMLHSLEVRAPFLDKQVAEFVAKLPISAKLRGFKRKFLLKKAFAALLPPEILKRNKRGFQIPVSCWLRGKLRPLLEELLAPERLRRQGIFEPAAVQALLDAHMSDKKDLRKQLWTLLVFQIWLEHARPDF